MAKKSVTTKKKPAKKAPVKRVSKSVAKVEPISNGKKKNKSTKANTKKSTKSKSIPKEAKFEVTIKSKVFGQAPQEYHFHLNNGEKLKSVYELVDALEHMGEDVFKHHVNASKNDFSNWIEDIFDEKHIAEEIRQVHDRVRMQRKLLRKMVDEVLR